MQWNILVQRLSEGDCESYSINEVYTLGQRITRRMHCE